MNFRMKYGGFLQTFPVYTNSGILARRHATKNAVEDFVRKTRIC